MNSLACHHRADVTGFMDNLLTCCWAADVLTPYDPFENDFALLRSVVAEPDHDASDFENAVSICRHPFHKRSVADVGLSAHVFWGVSLEDAVNG